MSKQQPKTIQVLCFWVACALWAGILYRQIKSVTSKTPLVQVELITQTGHADFVNSVAFSPDGKLLASGGSGYSVKLWEVKSGRELRAFVGHTGDVNSVAFSPDNKTLASGSSDNSIKIWDVTTGQTVHTLTGHAGLIYSVAYSSDGSLLASGSGDNTIKLWDALSGKPLRTLTTDAGLVCSVAFSPDGKTLASGSNYLVKGAVSLWDVATGTKLHTFKNPAPIESVAFSPDGKILAAGAYDDAPSKLWDVATGTELSYDIKDSNVHSLVFSPDGKTLATGSIDSTVKLWNVADGKNGFTLTGHTSSVGTVAFSPDGKILASGSADHLIKLWDVATGTELRTFTARTADYALAFSPDRQTLALGRAEGVIKLWDVARSKELRVLAEQAGVITHVQFSLDGRILAVHSNDNPLSLWDVAGGQEIGAFAADTCLAFSPDGKSLAIGSKDGAIKLWDITTRSTRTISGHNDTVETVAFSPDSKRLASASMVVHRIVIKVWEVATGQELQTITWQSDAANKISSSLKFSSDSKTLALAGANLIKLWGTATGQVLGTLAGHTELIDEIEFSPADNILATTSWDGTVKLWDIARGKESHSLSPNAEAIGAAEIRFSPDGKTLATSAVSGVIELWDVAAGEKLHTLRSSSPQNLLNFSTTGRTIISGNQSSTVKLWNTVTGAELCSWVILGENDWAATTPDGRFDTNTFDNTEGLHWVASDAPFTPLPLEIFARDYYEPQLFSRLLRCTDTSTCKQEFNSLRDLSQLNRVQPNVRIASVSPPDANHEVKVAVEVGQATGEFVRPGGQEKFTRTTGVYDVRLFRDGQLVGVAPREGAEKLAAQSISPGNSEAELKIWRDASQVSLDPNTGTQTLTFTVRLPRNKDAAKIAFTAYAFNEDRVKSLTAQCNTACWPLANRVAKTPLPPMKPKAYIISVGVSASEDRAWALEFAAQDAREMTRAVTEKLQAVGQYEVVPVTLVSDYGPDHKLSVNDATKANVAAVLALLAGQPLTPAQQNLVAEIQRNSPAVTKLQQATPDDLVLLSFSSHGYADNRGNFYLLPYDIGPAPTQPNITRLLPRAISSDELSLWLREVDGGEMALIIDACHSAASVKNPEFKPGPMGSRGLGQLAYDKAMRILTATRDPKDKAYEGSKLKRGFLSYALTDDGLKTGQADFRPQDRAITLAEWLNYAVAQTPKIYQRQARAKSDPVRFPQRKPVAQTPAASYQQPYLFDFARPRPDTYLLKP